ncbi:hypothetical protein SSAG_03445 [Streptomyces sp. Mg1]|nr:hypothetical protein SSAG_03445 [Streptomyces sp. Mg1]
MGVGCLIALTAIQADLFVFRLQEATNKPQPLEMRSVLGPWAAYVQPRPGRSR